LEFAPLSEWNYRSSTKLCKLAQMTLDQVHNKSHEGFMLGIQLRHKNTAPNSRVEKTMKLYNNILLQEIRKAKTSFTPQEKNLTLLRSKKPKKQDSSKGEDLTSRL
jgi:hypothetical protein